MPESLSGLTVVSFESRRSAEMAQLIRNYGGEPIQAPSLREVPLSDQHEALAFGETLVAGGCDVLLLLTGVGARLLIEVLATLWRVALVCRGPKPVAVLKEAGLAPALTVPEPNTWRDLLMALDGELPVAGKRVAVQEYGAPNGELVAGLEQRGARVTTVSVYGWALPEDTGPLRAAIERLAAGQAQVALFTSATQVDHLFRVAGEMGRAEALRIALRGRTVVACIGPVTTAALQAYGIERDLHPEHPKMGHLVARVARDAGGALDRKRRG